MSQQEITKMYDLLGRLNSPIQHIGGLDATRMLLEKLPINGNRKVLDIGCGTGYTACKIARDYGCKVVGIDLSGEMITKAKERAVKMDLEDGVEFRLADVFDLPFGDGEFDIALFESVLNLFKGNRQNAIDEVARTVKPGGSIGAGEPFTVADAPPEVLMQIADTVSFLGLPPTIEELRGLFENVGLEGITISERPASDIDAAMVFRDIKKTMGISGLLSYLAKAIYFYFTEPDTKRYAQFSRIILRNEDSNKYFGYAIVSGQKKAS